MTPFLEVRSLHPHTPHRKPFHEPPPQHSQPRPRVRPVRGWSTDHPHLCAVHSRRNRRSHDDHLQTTRPAGRPRPRRSRHHSLGGAVRHRRCPVLPRLHPHRRLLLPRREPVEGVRHLGRRERPLWIPHRRSRRRLHRVPANQNPVLVLRRRAGTGPARRAIAWTVRQLLQPRTLRPANHVAVGPADRSEQSQIPCRPPCWIALPPVVPLRDHLEPDRGRHHPGVGTPPQLAMGASLRRVPDLVRPRPELAGSNPDRSHQ